MNQHMTLNVFRVYGKPQNLFEKVGMQSWEWLHLTAITII